MSAKDATRVSGVSNAIRMFHSPSVLKFVLIDVKIVGGGHSNDILVRVPRSVQNLFVEIEAVNADFVLLPLSSSADLK